MSKDQIVRDTAYAIWEAEGRPEGRAREHWAEAEEQVAASLKGKSAAIDKATSVKAGAKSPAKGTPPVASAKARQTKPAKGAATAPAKKS